MLSLFQRKRPPVAGAPPPAPATVLPKGLMRPESAASLLATPRRQKLLEHIWQRTSLSRRQFATLYRAPLERYAELVQAFPASEAHHHAYLGGMLDHGLEIVAYSLKLRQSHLLPIGASPEDQAAQSEAWTAAVAYAALLHDIGKIAVDLHVELADGSIWHPWHGPLRQPYRFRYRDDREYRLHSAATGLLYHQLLDREALDWLTDDALWLVSKTVSDKLRAHLLSQGVDGIPANNTAVFNVLQDHGMLQPAPDGKAIWRATITSSTGWSHSFTLLRLAPALIWESGERPTPFAGTVAIDAAVAENDAEAPKMPPAAMAKAAPNGQKLPSWEGSSTVTASPPKAQPVSDVMEDMLAMVSTSGSPGAEQDVEPVAQRSYPADPSTPMPATAAVLPSPPPSTAKPPLTAAPPSGEHFMMWLKQGIASRRLIINDAKALVHSVNDTAYLVSPGVFQRYVQEHPHVGTLARQDKMPDWQWVQKRFEKLGLHRKHDSGLNIWICEVTGPRKSRKLHGYLLIDANWLFDAVPPNNPYLRVTQEI